jgi:PIN domain nuclease of toxin-antitoxin system
MDTQVLLWIVNEDAKLNSNTKKIYLDSNNEILLSLASIWEIAIKKSLNKLEIPGNLSDFVKDHIIGNDINILSLELSHIYRLENLPFHHRDPFDRLIIAQAIDENIELISNDKIFDKYEVKRIW